MDEFDGRVLICVVVVSPPLSLALHIFFHSSVDVFITKSTNHYTMVLRLQIFSFGSFTTNDYPPLFAPSVF